MKTNRAKEWSVGVDEFAKRLHVNVWVVVGLCVIRFSFSFNCGFLASGSTEWPLQCMYRIQTVQQTWPTRGEINLNDWQATQLC